MEKWKAKNSRYAVLVEYLCHFSPHFAHIRCSGMLPPSNHYFRHKLCAVMRALHSCVLPRPLSEISLHQVWHLGHNTVWTSVRSFPGVTTLVQKFLEIFSSKTKTWQRQVEWEFLTPWKIRCNIWETNWKNTKICTMRNVWNLKRKNRREVRWEKTLILHDLSSQVTNFNFKRLEERWRCK